MEQQLIEQPLMEANPGLDDDRDGHFCPECGQSLDLARYGKISAKRQTWEPFVFLLFGLCLTVAFGLRAWQTHTQLSRLDQQIADERARAAQSNLPQPGNPAMIVANTVDDLLTEHAALQVGFQRDIPGLGIGLFTLIVGAVGWLYQRPEVVDRRRNRRRPQGDPPSGRRQFSSLWNLGGSVATSLVRVVLLLFVTNIGLQLIRGTPPSFQIMDHTLTRIIAMVITIAGSLS